MVSAAKAQALVIVPVLGFYCSNLQTGRLEADLDELHGCRRAVFDSIKVAEQVCFVTSLGSYLRVCIRSVHHYMVCTACPMFHGRL